MDEGDYSPVDEDNTTHNTESQSSLIGKVQKTAEKFNNLINTQKLSKSSTASNDKEMTSKSNEISEMSSNATSLDVQNGKNLKDLINGSSMDNVGDSGIGQLSSNSISGTSVSGSISSSNSSSSTSPQDSHNDSGYSTRVGYSAGPSPSLSGKINLQLLYFYFLQGYITNHLKYLTTSTISYFLFVYSYSQTSESPTKQ